MEGRRVEVWHDVNQEKCLGEKVVKLCPWWNFCEGQIEERLSCSCDSLLKEIVRCEQGTEQNMKSHTFHQLYHFSEAELLWSKPLKRELVAETICLFGGILPLVTTTLTLGAEQENAVWAGEHVTGGEKGDRETETWMWQQSSEVPGEVSKCKTIYTVFPPPLSCSLLILTDNASLIRPSQFWKSHM